MTVRAHARLGRIGRGMGILVLVGIASSSVRAEIARLTVSVDGMACPFCTYGVEKKLHEVEGVASVEIHLEEGTAIVVPEEGRTPALDAVRRAIEKAGFTPGPVVVTAIGSILLEGESPSLAIRGTEEHYTLRSPAGGARAEGAAAARSRLTRLAEEQGPVAITGTLQPGGAGTNELAMDRVEIVHAARFSVKGGFRASSAARLRKDLEAVEGVYRASGNAEGGLVVVESLGTKVDEALLMKAARQAGFEIQPKVPDETAKG